MASRSSAPLYSIPDSIPEPYPVLLGMSPNAAAAIRDSSATERRLGGALQLPGGYGATASAYEPLANGVSAALGGQGTTQRDGQRPGAADASASGPLEQPDRGTRATGLDGVTTHEGVQGRAGVEQALHTSTTPEQPPPVHLAPADRQQPHTPAQQQQAAAQVTTSFAEGDACDDVSGPLQGHAATAGTRLSAEAQRAMAQLASQRAALVQALQARARGTVGAVEAQENASPGATDMEPPERPYDNGEEVVWYSIARIPTT